MKYKKLLFSVALGLGFISFSLAGSPSASAGLFDASVNEACGGAQLSGSSASCANANTSKVNNTITFILNVSSIIIGIVAVIMILIYGFKFITSGGDTNKIASAKSGLIWALVGLAVAALAQFIVQFVIAKV